mgnify:CR=1 FL=1
MNSQKLKTLVIMSLILLLSSNLFAQWQTNTEYGTKINVPSNWTKNSYMDGTDKVYDYMSPDENAAVQLRVFEANPSFTTALLAQVYEESMLPAGTKKLSLNEYTTVNGIPSKKGVYLLDYNGNEVGLSAIYIVQNNKGYVLTALIPSSMIQQKGEELKRVTNSFSIDGFQASSNTVEQDKKPSGLGGLMGGTSSSSSSFKITDVILSDRVDANNNAINPSNSFDTRTSEIFAVIKYQGGTSKDLFVSWIYKNWNRTISRDAYNFTANKGGIGVASITKPTNDWPAGNYLVELEMEGTVIKELPFTIEEKSSNSGGLGGSRSSADSSPSGSKRATITHNGFDFSTGQAGHADGETIGWNSGSQTNPNYSNGVWWRGKNTNNQVDLGTISLASVVELPSSGWDKVINPLIQGHVYIVKCEDGYAAFKVLKHPDPNSNLWETEVEYIYSANGNFK